MPRSRGKQFFRSSPPSYVRLFLLLVAVLYGISVLLSLGRTQSGVSNSNASFGLEEVLKNSHLRTSSETQAKVKPTPSKDLADLAAAKLATTGQQPPPPIKNYHLEEPDIHMRHPDESRPEKHSNNDTKGSLIHHIVINKDGSGPTNVAYVRDLQDERANPEFRHVSIQIMNHSIQVASLVGEKKVSRCLTLEKQGNGQMVWTKNPACLDPNTPLIAYNTATLPRFWCGKEIAPHMAVTIGDHCTDDIVHLFPQDAPSVSGQGMPPMILKSLGNQTQGETTLQPVECDIPCMQEPGISVTDGHDRRYFEGEPWLITQTLADSTLNVYARIERTDYRRNVYYSTQSFKSSVPLSFYDPEKHSLRNRPAVSFESTKPKPVYMVSTICVSPSTKRHKFFAAIHSIFPVESLGDCHHNTDVPEGMTIETMEGRLELMKQYRFVLAFDKTKEKDHISPIIWEAMISGTLPVIVGADNIRFHLPTRSFVDAGAYADWDELARAIYKINQNKTEWESYHAWRTDENEIAKFESMYEFTKTSPICRLCRWGYAKRYGLGWDHVTQKVSQTRLPRSLCTTPGKQLASKPFLERWISRNQKEEVAVIDHENDSEKESCSSMVESVIDIGSTHKVHRTLVEHDGVTDILITEIEQASIEHELVLQLHFPGVRNSEGAHFANTHVTVLGLSYTPLVTSISIQDEFSKVTLLANWVTTISCPVQGMLEVVVVKDPETNEQLDSPSRLNIPKRLRVIVEDMNVIHDKMTEYFPSSFSSKMIKDFVDPLEVYHPDS